MSVRNVVAVAHRVSWAALLVLVVVNLFVDLPGPMWSVTLLPAAVVAVLMLTTMVLQARAAKPRGGPAEPVAPVETEPPVTGRWTALNSPADKVPSHGTHVYGQTYAIDIVAEPGTGDGESPARPRSACSGRSSGATATSRPSAPRCSRWPTPRSSGRATAGATT